MANVDYSLFIIHTDSVARQVGLCDKKASYTHSRVV